jgi:hypothetical protein
MNCCNTSLGDCLHKPSIVFRSIIEKHFKLKSATLHEQLRRWEAEAPVAKPPLGALPGGGSGCAGTRASTATAAERVRGLLLGGASLLKVKSGGGTSERPIIL